MTATITPTTSSGRDGPPLLSIVARPAGGELRLHLVGELDHTTVGLLRDCVRSRAADTDVVLLKLDELAFSDAAALRAFVELDRQLRSAGGRLVLSNPSPFLLRLLRIAGLDVSLDIREREQRLDAAP